MNFFAGDRAFLILSDEFEQIVTELSDWKPNAIMLKKIRNLRANGISRIECKVFRASQEDRHAWITCRELDATETDPVGVAFLDLVLADEIESARA